MRDHRGTVIGLAIIGVGLVFLIGTVFRVNVWAFCWPVGLIAAGVWLLVRPAMVGADVRVEQKVLGDIRRTGDWTVVKEEIWLGVGDLRLDLVDAAVPTGETKMRVFGLVGHVNLIVPAGVGIAVSSWALLTESNVFGEKKQSFVTPLEAVSDGYEMAERKIRIEAYFFVNDLTVKRG